MKAHTTCFRCKQKFTNNKQANIHQRYCTSIVKSDGMGREFLESFSTTFTQSALSKDIQQGNIRNPHSFQVGGAYRSQLLQYNSLSCQRWTSNTIQRYGRPHQIIVSVNVMARPHPLTVSVNRMQWKMMSILNQKLTAQQPTSRCLIQSIQCH